MILIKADESLQLTFERLIKTMDVPVKWNGMFIVIDNYLILQGEVRSLFFHFDSKKVATNILEIDIEGKSFVEIAQHKKAQDVINIVLYAFGKWGNIKGLKVEKNYAQLGSLFQSIFMEFGVESDYSMETFRFYKNKIRITYEDVIEEAIRYQENDTEFPEEKVEGLWHKLVWKKEKLSFQVVETSLAERKLERIGNNFYMVGYLCPFCGEKLHMAVYPEGKEFQIETDEGGVILARSYTCEKCCNFYTPRPRKLIAEGDVYVMDFENDRVAYDDYAELIGRNGDRISNYHFNRFVKPQREETEAEVEKSLGEYLNNAKALSGEEFEDLLNRIEDGFYPDTVVERLEEQIENAKRERREAVIPERKETQKSVEERKRKHRIAKDLPKGKLENQIPFLQAKIKKIQAEVENEGIEAEAKEAAEGKIIESKTIEGEITENTAGNPNIIDIEQQVNFEKRATEQKEKYTAKIKVYKRLSDRQRMELKKQILNDAAIDDGTKKQLQTEIEQEETQENSEKLHTLVDNCEGKGYAVINRAFQEIVDALISESEKKMMLEQLTKLRNESATREVEALMKQVPQKLDRKTYQTYYDKLMSYEGIDLTPYENQIKERKADAEEQELKNLIKGARKITKEDYQNLLEKIDKENFEPELSLPYIGRIKDKIIEADQKEIDTICGELSEKPFEEIEQIYEQIKSGDFLPELKDNTLKMLEKRLAKIKTDECELLVQKLQKAFEEANLSLNDRNHFNPARKVLLKQAGKAETEVIDYAVANYAAGIGPFEYPILVVDTSRNKSGKEGFILTPEHIFYSNLMTSFHISVFAIEEVKAQTGFLNKGLYVYSKQGNKIKLGYAVETGELQGFTSVLSDFIAYLQEKPFSRKETYLVKEKHDTICCFRCGYVYKDGTTCPKCGYKTNG